MMAFSRILRSYPLHRMIVSGLSFCAVLVGARLLPTDTFSTLMTATFLAKFLQMLNLGVTTGYMVSRYSGEASRQRYDDGRELRFLLYYLTHMYSLAAIFLAVATVWFAEYRIGAIAFVLLVPLFVLEPLLRYRRNFSFSLCPEFLLSMALLAALGAYLFGFPKDILMRVYLAAIAVLGLILIIISTFRQTDDWRGKSGAFIIRDYMQLIIGGFPVYLGTALFLIGSSADRLLLPLYGAEEQIAIYFLAYQLSMGAMIIVTAFNFVNTIDLGEACQSDIDLLKSIVVEKLHTATLVASASYGAVVVSAFSLEAAFLDESFRGLGRLVALLGAGLTFFFISGAVTPIVAYFKRQTPLTVSMGLMAASLFANNAWAHWNDLGIIRLAAGTSIALTLHACYATWFTFSVLRDRERECSKLAS
ncbi:hypothetical protein N8540_04315 [Gammaproteobacteria bacterium]|nr:hypothetical protein [Gammaproteobacteria bacterium]